MEKSTMSSKIYDKIIRYSFYALFLLVPLSFWKDTSELFEMNKMWVTWGLTIIIGMFWFIKMILQRKFIFQRTPLDIPIGLFLLSQIISTVLSLDFHTSLWGYYSRFNGGLLSIFSYILLYYAFLSNFQKNLIFMVRRSMLFSLISGLVVALWGLPSHFGYDPTCLIFRGSFDVSCWTADFLPKVRIFSTLGQPDWLAAYLAILIPVSLTYTISKSSLGISNWKFWTYLLLTLLFYIDLVFTRARSGVIAIWISLIFLALSFLWIYRKRMRGFLLLKNTKFMFTILISSFIIVTFFIGTSIIQIDRFVSLDGLKTIFSHKQTAVTGTIVPASQLSAATAPSTQAEKAPIPEMNGLGGITESSKIRLLVWTGAINAWKDNFLFGTGVETFAFAYYKYKPASQNLTSEWNFLYNKAHNEYLNYLATTGLFGLGTYLLMIGSFLFLAIKHILKSTADRAQNLKAQYSQPEFKSNTNLSLALLAGYLSILITNFFGFSVVITNVYLYMIPAFILILTGQIGTGIVHAQVNKAAKIESEASAWQWTPIFFIFISGTFMLYSLFRFWQADVAYALGSNLDRAGQYQQAYPNLHKAVELRGSEPVFKDELSINDAIIAEALISQKSQDEQTKEQALSTASSLAQEAINTSNEVVSQNQNNPVFWKTRVRLFYTLSQVDSRYLPQALNAITKASDLAPNDANIWYNLGIIYGQNNDIQKGTEALEKTVALKPDYREAHYALGLFYHTSALDKTGKIVIDKSLNQKALDQMQYILKHIDPKSTEALSALQNWSK
jgi:putative inorganic carbon (hco3(-)) transporter